MTYRDWMIFFSRLPPETAREMGNLLIAQADAGPRDAVREERMRQAIEAMPVPSDNGLADSLRSARKNAGNCCTCGKPKEKEELACPR